MKRIVEKGLLIVFSALLITFLWYAPAWLRPMFQRDIYREWMENKTPAWQGIVHVWNLYDGETKIDSAWLRSSFKRYEKQTRGVFIEMATLTPDEAAALLAEGNCPDLWVFPETLMPQGGVRDVQFALPLPQAEKKIESDFEFDVGEGGAIVETPEAPENEQVKCAAWVSSLHPDFADQARALGAYLAEQAQGMVK